MSSDPTPDWPQPLEPLEPLEPIWPPASPVDLWGGQPDSPPPGPAQVQLQSQFQSQSAGQADDLLQTQSQTQTQSQSPSPLQRTVPPALAAAPAASPAGAWLRVRHHTRYNYDTPVELAHHAACLCPRDTASQAVRNWRLAVDPAPDGWPDASDMADTVQRLSLDPWGNGRLVLSHSRVHDHLSVISEFDAFIRPRPWPDPAASPPWEEVAASLRYQAGGSSAEAVEFALASPYASSLAPQGADGGRADTGELAAFAARAFTAGRSLAAGGLALMHQVHDEFRYETSSTHVGTRAVEALALRSGVCQDFAHVMIAACRALGLAARYVSGYLLTHPAKGQARLIGADASHAWVEVWCPQQGWLALDPTNAVPAGTDHVTLAWGRDYGDVAPLRGVIRGGGRAKPRVAVTVEPLADPAG